MTSLAPRKIAEMKHKDRDDKGHRKDYDDKGHRKDRGEKGYQKAKPKPPRDERTENMTTASKVVSDAAILWLFSSSTYLSYSNKRS